MADLVLPLCDRIYLGERPKSRTLLVVPKIPECSRKEPSMITPVVSEVSAEQDQRRRDYAERSRIAHSPRVAINEVQRERVAASLVARAEPRRVEVVR